MRCCWYVNSKVQVIMVMRVLKWTWWAKGMRVGSWKNWCLLEERITASNLTRKEGRGCQQYQDRHNVSKSQPSFTHTHTHTHRGGREEEDNVARRETMIIPFPGCWLVVIHPTRQELAIINWLPTTDGWWMNKQRSNSKERRGMINKMEKKKQRGTIFIYCFIWLFSSLSGIWYRGDLKINQKAQITF